MRRWNDLTPDEQQKAIEKQTNVLLGAVVKGAIRFNDELNQDTLQADIDKAIEKAEANRTPWFAGEFVYDAVGEQLRSMAEADTGEAYYPETGEQIIRL